MEARSAKADMSPFFPCRRVSARDLLDLAKTPAEDWRSAMAGQKRPAKTAKDLPAKSPLKIKGGAMIKDR